MLITILNVNRRHLSNFETFLTITEKQRFVKNGEIGKNHEKVSSAPGADIISEEKPPVTVEEVAKKIGVGTRTVEQMKYIDTNRNAILIVPSWNLLTQKFYYYE
jgi:hypothetical protein